MEHGKPKLVGLNHVALEVDDVEEALRFYGAVFAFDLRGTHRDDSGGMAMAFLDMGDQFLALSRGRTQSADTGRHFGLVVDDRSNVMARAVNAGATIPEGRPFNFLDPWGNHIEIVAYREVQFIKAPAILDRLGVSGAKSEGAEDELRKKGLIE